MKLMIKILFAPVMFALWLFTGLCKIVLQLSSAVCGIVALLFAVMGVLAFVTNDPRDGCISFVLAALLSPYGFPYLAALALAQFYILRLWLKEKIYE